MEQPVTGYPATYSVDYPDRPLNRLSTFFRLFASIPIWIILVLLTGFSMPYNLQPERHDLFFTTAGLVVLPTVLMILFRQKYPRWWFDWNIALTRFSYRTGAYLLLLRDEYPSTDEEQAVHVDTPYPDAKNDLNRWLPLVKWLLAIPHWVILIFLFIAVIFCTLIAWFATLFRVGPSRFRIHEARLE